MFPFFRRRSGERRRIRRRTIQIAESGWESIVGGMVVGVYCKETEEFRHDIIPVEEFQDRVQADRYLNLITESVDKLFHEMGVSSDDRIELDSSYVFRGVERWLREHEYKWESAKPSPRLRKLTDDAFIEHLISLGVPPKLRFKEAKSSQFMFLLKWVQEDFRRRQSICKTGLDSWNKLLNSYED